MAQTIDIDPTVPTRYLSSDDNDVAMTTAEVEEKAASDHPLFDDAVSEQSVRPEDAIAKFKSIIQQADPTGALAKIKEESILHLGLLYTQLNRPADFKALFVQIREFFKTIPKSRTAKIVRALIDTVGDDVTHANLQQEICIDAIEWCQSEKRTFLKQRIQTRLAAVYLATKQYSACLTLIQSLIRDVKRFDDKLLLVEIFLVESRAQLALLNIPKSKGALTAARSSANAIYCPPALQANIDIQAGILCAAEQDHKTAYSYFYESYEGYHTIKDTANAVRSLKYMILSKIISGQYDDVNGIISGKAGVRYAGIEMEAMKAVTNAYRARSIQQFDAVYTKYDVQLARDPIISSHLTELKEQLFEKNLLRLLEPYSRVQIDHIANSIKLTRKTVEAKLSEMILDKKLYGIIDEESADLIVFDKIGADPTYEAALETIEQMSGVVDRLYEKAKQLAAA